MKREEILKKAGVKPDAFCPACWHQAKRILRLFETNEVKKQRFWVSWICEEDDHRPVNFPPNEGVLGWWCSGHTGVGGSVMVAVVLADGDDEAKEIIKKDWPEFSGEWRFFEEQPDDFCPGDRFPLNDWMEERFK